MKKRLLTLALACMLLCREGAFAQSAEEKLLHIMEHPPRTVFICSGDLVKLRVAPNSKKMHGRMEKGERFIVLDAYGEWVQIEIAQSTPDNPNTSRGMTGWVHVDYVACPCEEEIDQ